MLTLSDLGPRLCVLGRSNSGKSTLAQRLGQTINNPVYHLDQIAHVPGTGWQPRPYEDFQRDHDALLSGDTWIIEGNYKRSMPQRLARATSALWLDMPLAGCLFRYIARSIRNDDQRPGRLA